MSPEVKSYLEDIMEIFRRIEKGRGFSRGSDYGKLTNWERKIKAGAKKLLEASA